MNSLKFFLAVGIVALVAVLCAPFILSSYLLRQAPIPRQTAAVQTATSTNGEMGELGSVCAGKDRLPCRPGLTCTVDYPDDGAEGVCEKAETGGLGQVGEACGDGKPACAPILYCKAGAGICQRQGDGGPQILQVMLDGMEARGGTYASKAGAKVAASVHAVNAKSVILYVSPAMGVTDATAKEVGEMKLGKDGLYALKFTSGDEIGSFLTVMVTTKDGDAASLSIPIVAE